jgi:hypothetical protein
MKRSLAAAAAVLAACAQLEQPPAPVEPPPAPAPPAEPAPAPALPPAPVVITVPAPPPPEPEENRQAVELLGYTQRVALMAADEQRRELGAANQALARDRSSYARLKVALLYAAPGTAIQDDARALAMLEQVGGAAGPLKNLAVLVHAQVSERVKAQKRADQLKEQLDALRDVERSIIERGQQTQPRKP